MPDQPLYEIQRALEEAGQRDAVRILQSIQSEQSSSSPAPPRKPPPVVACTLCRRCKAKCIRSDPSASQCDRCKATGCVCIVEKHKRGRKRVRGLDLPRIDESEVATQIEDPFNHSPHTVIQTSPSSAPPIETYAPFSRPLPEHDSLHHDTLHDTRGVDVGEPDFDSDSDATPSLDQSEYAANPLPFISGTDRPFSLRNLLNPSSTRMAEDRRLGRAKRSDGDLIARGVLSLDVAHQLFDFFINTLNPIIMLFDPHLHTFEHIHDKSRFLLAAMLAAAARFVAPTLAPTIAQEVAQCSVQAVLDSQRNIETVQAWMVMFFYKAPRDDRGWTYVGMLCRLAVEIGLDRTQSEDAPGSSERSQRERRNRVRTWMLAYMMDRAVSSTTGRDWCLRGHDRIIQNTRSFSQHPFRLHGDGVIAGFAELRRIASHALDHLSRKGSAPRELASTVHRPTDIGRYLLTVNYDLDEWGSFWQGELVRQRSPERYWAYLRFFELHIRLTLNSFAVDAHQLLRPAPNTVSSNTTVDAERRCYEIAHANLVQLQVIRALDVSFLQHAQDSISIMVAYAACFLRALANSPNTSDTQRDKAIELIHFTSEMFKTVSRDQETTPALQAGYLHSLFAQGGQLDHLPPMSVNPQSWDVSLPNAPASSAAPHIDVTDFGAWLTAFELDTLPEPIADGHNGVQDVSLAPHDTGPPAAGGNSDWDAIFLSWLNPDPSA